MTESKPSKSARKRQVSELQQLGEMLIGLTDAQLVGIVTEPRLIDAVRQARTINAHGALRRQKQLIGKIMRDVEAEPIKHAIDALVRRSHEDKQLFKESESWRERLCADPAIALPAFEALTGSHNGMLRQILQEYVSATRDPARKTLYRQIFREIHRSLSEEAP